MLDFFADVTVSVSTLGKLKHFLTTVGIEPTTFGLRGQHNYQLLDEVEQNITICRWRADQLFKINC